MRSAVSLLLFCGVFVALGLIFLPYPGAQFDELFFVTAIYHPEHVEYAMKFSFGNVPIMLVTYTGTVKCLLYAPLLHWFEPGRALLRVPVLLLGAVSIALFFLALKRVAGGRAAFAAAALLATDAVYLLTCVFDWGPVVIQHVMLTLVLYAGVRYGEDGRTRWLWLAGFCAGLALWDKALVVWLFAGIGAGLLLMFRGPVLAIVKDRRRLGALVIGFLIGAAPFLYYNKIHPLRTFTATEGVGDDDAAVKLRVLDNSLNGSALFGYIVRETPEGRPANLKTWEKAPLWLAGKLRAPRRSFQHLLFVLAILAAPLLWRGPYGRLALFTLTVAAIAWLMMLYTRGAGAAAHHAVLLWPAPHLLAGLLLAEAVRRFSRRGVMVGAAVFGICIASNIAVVNQYLAQFISSGPTVIWTDASQPLVAELGREPGRTVFAADWGVVQQVEFYGKGRLSFHRADDEILNLHEPARQKVVEEALTNPANLFVTHTEGRDIYPGVRRKLIDFAAARGYRDNITRVIADRHGVPIFEIHEFQR